MPDFYVSGYAIIPLRERSKCSKTGRSCIAMIAGNKNEKGCSGDYMIAMLSKMCIDSPFVVLLNRNFEVS